MPLRILAARKIAAANLIQVLSVAGMFVCSSWARCTCGASSATARWRSDSPSCPSRWSWARCGSGTPTGWPGSSAPRAVLIAGLVLIAGSLVLFTQAPIHGGYAIHDLPVMVLMGAGAGLAFPALMTVAMAGATQPKAPAWPPAW